MSACTSSPEPPPPATGPVDVPAPATGTPAVLSTCRALLAAVPESLGNGLARRPVNGDATRAAAWADPAVTLACGVPAANASAEPVEIGPPSGGTVEFDVDDDGAANVWTTRDRKVPIAVRVPDAYDGQVVLRLLPAILQTVPER